MRVARWGGVFSVLFLMGLIAQLLDGTMAAVNQDESRTTAAKLYKEGNYAEALPLFVQLAENLATDGTRAGEDLRNAVSCLQQLNRVHEMDELLINAIEAHADSWQFLLVASEIYRSIDHYGFLIAGDFERGHHRGGGNHVSAERRDRVRSVQLLLLAIAESQKDSEAPPLAISNLYSQLADAIGESRHGQAWKLQDLTDLEQLPDYDEFTGMRGWRGGYSLSQGAPVDEDGNPVLYQLPDSWEAAKSDGERWRWAMRQTVEFNPQAEDGIDLQWAQFLQSQFGVETLGHSRTMADGSILSGSVKLHELSNKETVAKLATGDRRISLPDEFNHLAVIQKVIDRAGTGLRRALDMMIQVRMSRHQYPQAATLLEQAMEIARNDNDRKQLQDRLDQITGNWVQFDAVRTQAAGQAASLDIRYRNGSQVRFTARPIDVDRLLTNTRKYLESQPAQLDHNRIQLHNIGYRLIQKKPEEYLGDPVAQWDVRVEPPANHFDGHETIKTPLENGGAYWLEAAIDGGNTTRVVLWIADAAITRKQVEGGTLYFVADAATGQPIERANLEFFGFRQERIGRTRNARVVSRRFPDRTDGDGLCTVKGHKDNQLQWMTIARAKDGRFAFEGFNGFWNPQKLNSFHYSPTRVYLVTDRPVYRPKHEVKYRMWVRQPRYHEDAAIYANQPFLLQISNPRGDVVEEHAVTTDRWGGVDGTWIIPDDAVLGHYTIAICRDVGPDHKPQLGSGSFRVEEYRKPEFEVTIESPDKPVKLGDTISAVINARYYFGAPVTNAEVHYKVERTKKDSRWYPETRWDWLYSPGYWWFAPDTTWYPGWKRWGCVAPLPPWIGWSPDPPEVVAEGNATIAEDGTFRVTIDTSPAQEQHGDSDHSYRITAEVVDQSRRTISASGEVLVARNPFKLFVWTDRGHYQTGDTVTVRGQARTPDGSPVAASGKVTLYRVAWNEDQASETELETFDVDTAEDGSTAFKFVIPEAGQYRVSIELTDADGNTQEGGQLLYVRGPNDNGRGYRFNDLELILDKRDYQPGETAVLQINTNHEDSTVLLFVRPVNGVCPTPEVLRISGKSVTRKINIRADDMPNIYVEALTISDGRLHTVMKEIVVPPKKKVAKVEVIASKEEYRPGEIAELQLKLTDDNGQPFIGNTVLTAFDASLEYIAASAIPEIREFFWSARRHHYQRVESTLQRMSGPLVRQGEPMMTHLSSGQPRVLVQQAAFGEISKRGGGLMMKSNAMPVPAMAMDAGAGEAAAPGGGVGGAVEPAVRSSFADTAMWLASVESDTSGIVNATFTVPDNLTTWKIRAWTLGEGTRVGSGSTDVICSKKLIIRPQTPRFFTQKDQITLSAIVHNYLESAKEVEVVLETEGGQLRHLTSSSQTVHVPAGGEARVDWPVEVIASGEAVVRMKALTDEESDAAQLTVPAQVHGLLKTESFSGVLRQGIESANLTIHVPAERIEEQARLEVGYSPSLAGAMVDALPYLIEYPYGCTEQTLNRFLPAVLTQRTLRNMGLDLDDIRQKRTNLNSQELGNSDETRQRWNERNRNPVFDSSEMDIIVRDGVEALTEMQLADGGWGWFSGYGERSSAHLTALVVHGLQVAHANDVPVLPDVIARGVTWLKTHQTEELNKLREGDRRRKENDPDTKRRKPYRMQANNLDAFVAWVLSGHEANDTTMTEYLFRDRLKLSVYGLCLTGLVLDQQQEIDRRDQVLRNVDQYLQQDDENQTAWLNLPGDSWWYWYGSENEAHAMYLRLLLKVRPQDETASRLVKYLLNNRRVAGHWNSTRDTAMVIESMAEYIRVSGENRPDMTVEVLIDGQVHKRVRITADNLFSFDNIVLLEGDAVRTGVRHIEIRRTGTGPVYFNAYLTNFTLEDPITASGLEVKVQRRFYRLERDDQHESVRGSRGQSVHQQVTRWKRTQLENLSEVRSGDLVEVELLVDSKNDYEYLMLEDRKPSGFEPDDQRSGYIYEGLRAYRELRDDRVTFFLSRLARGNHSVSYRLRAETPGRMSALPARIEGMYAPELVGNSDEFKLQVSERE